MKVKDNLKLFGEVIVVVTDAKTGKVLYTERGRNLIVSQGKSYIRRNIIKDAMTFDGNFLALSTNTTDPADTETSMPPTILTPVKTAAKGVVTEGGVEYCQWSAQWGTNEGNGVIGSVGICEQSNGNGLWARYKFANAINKTSDMILTIYYRIAVN